MTTMTTATNSTLVNEICLATILGDAKTWHKRNYPRIFARSAATDKHMLAKMKRENDAIFDAQNIEFDLAMKQWYEKQVLRYGGEIKDLPWN